ncbi:MAG: bifunctional methylenetetrahydrofolate dehydrogenase/methenyltetrahydrofolate cyclohydrolase FolD [Holophagales bacterium]|nr:bifunctional methylenetetrahydrofolate dehydrogenase/methenyltetrahydrofolate cyclohydrolase FolD [Holophagales bacterium]
MNARALDGKAVASEIHGELASEVGSIVAEGGRRPKLVAVLVGEDPASAAYVGSKARTCKKVGMLGETLRLPGDSSAERIESTVVELNEDPETDGILVQLPLPDHVDERRILELIAPEKDVDGFHPMNVGRLWAGEAGLAPATPSGIVEMLKRTGVELKGRHAVIVGRSNIVGKPMAGLLLRQHCTVTICHSRTRHLEKVCQQADILVAAVGRTAMIGADHVREGAVVIDVGMNKVDDPETLSRLYPADEKKAARFVKKGYVLTGDVDFHAVAEKAAAITPVPGGVGPLTVAMVVSNTLRAHRLRVGSVSAVQGTP